MIALFPDLTFVNDENPVGVFDRRQPVRDDQCRAIFQQFAKRFLNQPFRLGVHRAGRLVENENFRVEGERPGERQ